MLPNTMNSNTERLLDTVFVFFCVCVLGVFNLAFDFFFFFFFFFFLRSNNHRARTAHEHTA